jgi:mRNA interferase MazF
VKPVVFTPAAEADLKRHFSGMRLNAGASVPPSAMLSTSPWRRSKATRRRTRSSTGTRVASYCPDSHLRSFGLHWFWRRRGGTDWVLCQITSRPYGDPSAFPLSAASFSEGGLPRESFVRPGKLFTANESIVVRRAGVLTAAAHRDVVGGVIRPLRSGVK